MPGTKIFHEKSKKMKNLLTSYLGGADCFRLFREEDLPLLHLGRILLRHLVPELLQVLVRNRQRLFVDVHPAEVDHHLHLDIAGGGLLEFVNPPDAVGNVRSLVDIHEVPHPVHVVRAGHRLVFTVFRVRAVGISVLLFTLTRIILVCNLFCRKVFIVRRSWP